MKRIQFAFVLAAFSTLAACGGTHHYVSRGGADPMSFAPMSPDYDESTSERSVIDLLSLT